MASLAPEDLASIKGGGDAFESVELPEINSALLTSLLDESYGDSDDDDEEKLRSVMQSLEAEINLANGDSSSGESEIGGNGAQQMDGHDCPVSPSVDFGWVDMAAAPSLPLDASMDGWYVDPCGDGMGSMTEDYSQFHYGVAVEGHQYSSLWQENVEDVTKIYTH